jgi:hypothetical protein
MRKEAMILAGCLLVMFAACEERQENAVTTEVAASSKQQAPAPGGEAEFEATVSGAIERELQGTSALAGAKYGRYHINLASRREGSEQPVVIALGRNDTTMPAAGTYPLDGSDPAGFSGTVELHGDSERNFEITSGELTITSATADSLRGSFTFDARERVEEYGAPQPEIRVTGLFRSKVR